MTIGVQEIAVYFLFALALGYFTYRFYNKNLRKKTSNGKNCQTGSCGCNE